MPRSRTRPNPVVLLGPQRHRPSLRAARRALRPSPPIAVITAGWEEREDEDEELREQLGCRTVNLRVFSRTEELLHRERSLLDRFVERREALYELRALYQLRLTHALEAARQILRHDGDAAVLEPERADAIEAVRALDIHHVNRVQAIDRTHDGLRHEDAVRQLRAQVATNLEACGAVVIAGGHVGTLLNRLWLLDPASLFGDRLIVAWSAGAMVICERIVLFHDSPPQGAGDAEILAPGLGLCPGIVPLPHARQRLDLDDHLRVSLFARRFAPAVSVVMDEGTRLEWNGVDWRTTGAIRPEALGFDGRLERLTSGFRPGSARRRAGSGAGAATDDGSASGSGSGSRRAPG